MIGCYLLVLSHHLGAHLLDYVANINTFSSFLGQFDPILQGIDKNQS